MAFVCVVNPVSGKGKGVLLAEALSERLRLRGHEVRTLLTQRDAKGFADQCSQISAQDRVICIGGDGTLLYFLNHAVAFRDLAFYGMGTANVISIEFALPKKLDDFVAMLERGKTQAVFPAQLEDGRRFLMMASLGIDGAILARVSQRLKNRLGKLAFVPALLSACWHYRYPLAQVSLDNGAPQALSLVALCRFQHYGGKFVIAPQADPTGSLIQVVGIEGRGLRSLYRFMTALFTGNPQRPGVFSGLAKRVTVSGLLPAQLDGDYIGEGIGAVEVCAESFPLVVP